MSSVSLAQEVSRLQYYFIDNSLFGTLSSGYVNSDEDPKYVGGRLSLWATRVL